MNGDERYQKFIEKAKKVHGNKYDYSAVNYSGSRFKIDIICNEHGKFHQIANDHLNGHGCPKCSSKTLGLKKRASQDKVIEQFKQIHGDKYDYSNVVYKGSHVKIDIICNEHGLFQQNPANHLSGHGCPKCGFKTLGFKKRSIQSELIEQFKQIHGDKYDYSKVEYKTSHIKINIICNDHGIFQQTPSSHLNGNGCPKCAPKTIRNKLKSSQSEVIEQFKQIHGDKYDYSKVEYRNAHSYIEIICNKHGSFWQSPSNHCQGRGCSKCKGSVSKWETEMTEFIKSLNVNVERTRKIIAPYELDIFIPDHNLAIEANGVYFHSEKFNRDRNHLLFKTEKCAELGITLLHFFEDEWCDKQEIVKSMIRNKLGKVENKIFARKCDIRIVPHNDTLKFLNNNHLQGKAASRYDIGLYHNDELVSIMTFAKPRYNKNYEWELIRFCNKINTSVVGSASKLLRFFIKNKNPKNIISYANKRFSMGNIYSILGFTANDLDSQPNYYWVKSNKRYSRVKFQKHKLKNILPIFDQNLSEKENMENNDYYRLWDCGNSIHVWKNNL